MDGIVWIVLAYFIGAIPSGYMIGRVFYGVNLKKVGSGNIGATNAYRELGAVAGFSVFICDFLKGFLAVHLGMPDPTLVLACAIAYICAPAVLAAFLVWLAIFKWKHIVSLGSIVAAPVVAIVMFFMDKPIEYVAFAAVAAIIIIGKHKDNIGRLLRGEEKPISREKR